jgi:hypothetical protein
MEKVTLYIPGGRLMMKYSPFSSVAAPKEVPSTMTFVPIRGFPVPASVTRPDILPVCPAKAREKTQRTARIGFRALMLFLLIIFHCSNKKTGDLRKVKTKSTTSLLIPT